MTGARWAETRCTARAKARRSIINGTAGQRWVWQGQRTGAGAFAQRRGREACQMIGVRPRERDNFHSGGLRARVLRCIDQLLAQTASKCHPRFSCFASVLLPLAVLEARAFCLQQSQPYRYHKSHEESQRSHLNTCTRPQGQEAATGEARAGLLRTRRCRAKRRGPRAS
jgi:hypothetical protein